MMFKTGKVNQSVVINTSDVVKNKLKLRGFRATSLSAYDFSTFYIPSQFAAFDRIKNLKFDWVDLSKGRLPFLPVTKEPFFTSKLQNRNKFGHIKICAKP